MSLLTLSGIKQLNERVNALETRVVDVHDMPLYPNSLDTNRENLLVADGTTGWSSTTGTTVDEEVLFEGRPTRRIEVSSGDSARQPRYAFPSTLDLTQFDYIDVWVRFSRRLVGADSITVRFSDDDYNNERTHSLNNPYDQLNPPNTWIRYRLHLKSFSGELSLAQINRVRFWCNTSSSTPLTIHIARMDAVNVRCGVVSIDFDDHHASVYDVAFPVMQNLGLRGSFFIITAAVGNQDRITWDQLREMQDAGWLIGSHTHDHVDLGDSNVSDEEKLFSLRRARALLEQQGFPVGARFLSLPYGARPNTEAVYQEIINNYAMIRQTTSGEARYRAVGNPSRTNLAGTSITPAVNAQDVKDRIDTAIAEKLMYRPLWHYLVPNPQAVTEWDPDDFAEVCEYIADKRDAGELVVLDPYDMLVSDKGELIRTGGQDAILTHDGQSHVLIKLP